MSFIVNPGVDDDLTTVVISTGVVSFNSSVLGTTKSGISTDAASPDPNIPTSPVGKSKPRVPKVPFTAIPTAVIKTGALELPKSFVIGYFGNTFNQKISTQTDA